MGFCSVHLGNDAADACEPLKPASKKYYVGISGGGWRALSGHMGAFRVLSEKGALKIVDMFSSVSGGTWFLTKLAFDNDFSTRVLGSETSIAEEVMEWMESKYFAAFRDVRRGPINPNDPHQDLKNFISSVVSQGPAALKNAVGAGIVAFENFDYSWQGFVENTILGDIAQTELARASVVDYTLSKFGDDFNLAFNWNQQNKFHDDTRDFFLKEKNGEIVQYPAYVSTVYEHRSGAAEPKVDVLMRAQPANELFDICHQDNTAGDARGGLFKRDPTPEEIEAEQVCGDFKFDFNGMTIGQAASASSAAAGPVASKTWMQNLVQFARTAAQTEGLVKKVAMCTAITTILRRVIGKCNQDAIIDEIRHVLDCESEDSEVTAERWSSFLRKMAIEFKMSTDSGQSTDSFMAFDAVGSAPRMHQH